MSVILARERVNDNGKDFVTDDAKQRERGSGGRAALGSPWSTREASVHAFAWMFAALLGVRSVTADPVPNWGEEVGAG
jgi:hypothetical protein